jgi:hypothetical protein
LAGDILGGRHRFSPLATLRYTESSYRRHFGMHLFDTMRAFVAFALSVDGLLVASGSASNGFPATCWSR